MAIDTQFLQNVPVFQLLVQDELKDLLAETEERSYMASLCLAGSSEISAAMMPAWTARPCDEGGWSSQ